MIRRTILYTNESFLKVGWEWGWGCDPYGVSWEAVPSHAKKLHKGAKGKSVELNFSAQLKRQSGTRKKKRNNPPTKPRIP